MCDLCDKQLNRRSMFTHALICANVTKSSILTPGNLDFNTMTRSNTQETQGSIEQGSVGADFEGPSENADTDKLPLKSGNRDSVEERKRKTASNVNCENDDRKSSQPIIAHLKNSAELEDEEQVILRKSEGGHKVVKRLPSRYRACRFCAKLFDWKQDFSEHEKTCNFAIFFKKKSVDFENYKNRV